MSTPDEPLHTRKMAMADSWAQALATAESAYVSKCCSATEILAGLSHTMDSIVQTAANDALALFERKYAGAGEPFAVCAVGGYGRAELYPHSDIDLLFLYPWKAAPQIESLAESVLYLLWDLGFRVGHASRSPDECIRLGREDTTIRSNLLDIRFIVGDRNFYASTLSRLESELLHRNIRSYVSAKIDEMRSRRARFGQSAYLLEPNIKEGPGGLRDLQTVYWLSRTAFRAKRFHELFQLGLMEQADTDLLTSSHERLAKIRIGLHLYAQQAGNRLTFDLQEKIARDFGYEDTTAELASEAFMRSFYELTRETAQVVDFAADVIDERLRNTTSSFWFQRKRSLGDGFYVYRNRIYGTASQLRTSPPLLLHAFRLAQVHDLPLSHDLKKELQRNAGLLTSLSDDQLAICAATFRDILRTPKNLYPLLMSMNELGVLRAYLPQFEHLYCRIQHDTYHIYTADVHLLVCLKVLTELLEGAYEDTEPEVSAVAASIHDRLTLTAAVLLHDIGKGYNEDHSVKGAELVVEMAERLGLDSAQTRRVALLVRRHLMMSHTAQRRDLSDAQVIREFAAALDSTETLDMLLVLTFCDQHGVGPNVWTPWKRELLLQLYNDAKRVLEREDIQGVYKHRIRAAKQRLRKKLDDGGPLLDEFLAQMPPRFFVRHDDHMAQVVFDAYKEGREKGVAMQTVEVPDIGTYVILSEPDRPGLFAFHAGLFRMADMSIVDAEGFVLPKSGWVLNLFLVNPADPLFFKDRERALRFRRKVLRHMRSKTHTVVAQVRRSQLDTRRPRSRRRARVRVDQNLSNQFTVFEVRGWDRMGLLHDLATVLYEHGCQIFLARIHTEGQRVSDSFYVQDLEGRKLSDPAQIAAIQDALLAQVED